METKKMPKFDWDAPQGTNSGHTRQEWGDENTKESPKIRTITAYTVVWNTK